MKELHLSIVSPEKSVFDGEVKIVPSGTGIRLNMSWYNTGCFHPGFM